MTPYEIINKYVGNYNNAVKAKDREEAIRWGSLAVRDAEAELKKEGLIASQKAYYVRIVNQIKDFLANPDVLLAKKPKANGSVEQEDKIKSTDWFAAPIPNLTFKDIAGLREVRNQFVVNVFAPSDPKCAPIYQKYRGMDCGMQVLLYGPPGTGKTHIVKCLAGQMKCKIAVVQIKDVMASLVGDGAKIISEIFEQAKQFDRSIIFFDEIDAIASSREGEDSRHTKEQLTTLLTNMDGFTSKAKPGQLRVVIAATNRPWALDSAVKRGGRFDTQIYVPLPDKEARKTLVMRALGKDKSVKNRVDIPCADDVDIDWLVDRFEGFAGADIKSVCRQAVSRPMEREISAIIKGISAPDHVTREDFEWGFSRYINSVTDEMLLQFDAYSLNMEYGVEYIKFKCNQIINDLWANNQPEPFFMRWFKELCESGYVWLNFGEKYNLSFLEKDWGIKLFAPKGTGEREAE